MILKAITAFFLLTGLSLASVAGELNLSDGYDTDIRIQYSDVVTVSGSNGGCVEAKIESIILASRSGQPIGNAYVMIDPNPVWLHNSSPGSVKSTIGLTCSGHYCIYQGSTHSVKFAYQCSGPAGSNYYHNFAKFVVNNNVILDPWASAERKSAFQLNFGY